MSHRYVVKEFNAARELAGGRDLQAWMNQEAPHGGRVVGFAPAGDYDFTVVWEVADLWMGPLDDQSAHGFSRGKLEVRVSDLEMGDLAFSKIWEVVLADHHQRDVPAEVLTKYSRLDLARRGLEPDHLREIEQALSRFGLSLRAEDDQP